MEPLVVAVSGLIDLGFKVLLFLYIGLLCIMMLFELSVILMDDSVGLVCVLLGEMCQLLFVFLFRFCVPLSYSVGPIVL